MRNEYKDNVDAVVPLTLQTLKELKSRGFQYVLVDAFLHGKCPDHIQPAYFVLSPLKELPKDKEKKGIYESLDSHILLEWASSPAEGIKVYIAKR